jgi:hypothetical protein
MYSMRNLRRIRRILLCSIRPVNAPAFVVNPKIARRALEKQRTDELEYARLLEDNVPTAPIYSGLDGGMNEVFLARFPVRVTQPCARQDLTRGTWPEDISPGRRSRGRSSFSNRRRPRELE